MRLAGASLSTVACAIQWQTSYAGPQQGKNSSGAPRNQGLLSGAGILGWK